MMMMMMMMMMMNDGVSLQSVTRIS